MINCLIDIYRSWSRSQSRSRFIFYGSEPEPPEIGRLRNSGLWCISRLVACPNHGLYSHKVREIWFTACGAGPWSMFYGC